MRIHLRTAGIIAALLLLILPEVLPGQLGRSRRVRRRTAVVVSSSTHASDEAAESSQNAAQDSTAKQQSATAQQQSATAAQQSATAQQQAATAQQQSGTAAAAGTALAVGTVVSTLPSGCSTSSVSGVEYSHCGNDWYRSAFQGNTLVYVTTAPPQ
jgi:hypothetical protein